MGMDGARRKEARANAVKTENDARAAAMVVAYGTRVGRDIWAIPRLPEGRSGMREYGTSMSGG